MAESLKETSSPCTPSWKNLLPSTVLGKNPTLSTTRTLCLCLPPWPTLVSRWHLSLLCNGRVVSSLLVSGPAAAAAAAAVGTPGSPAPVGAASAAALLASAPPAACAYTPTQKKAQ